MAKSKCKRRIEREGGKREGEGKKAIRKRKFLTVNMVEIDRVNIRKKKRRIERRGKEGEREGEGRRRRERKGELNYLPVVPASQDG